MFTRSLTLAVAAALLSSSTVSAGLIERAPHYPWNGTALVPIAPPANGPEAACANSAYTGDDQSSTMKRANTVTVIVGYEMDGAPIYQDVKAEQEGPGVSARGLVPRSPPPQPSWAPQGAVWTQNSWRSQKGDIIYEKDGYYQWVSDPYARRSDVWRWVGYRKPKPVAQGHQCPYRSAPVVYFDCTNYPEACIGNCFNYYCRESSRAGVFPKPLHRGEVNSSDTRRRKGGYKPPGQSNSPCKNKDSNGKNRGHYNSKTGEDSMDEFPMAMFIEGGLHGRDGPGYRCIEYNENVGAGSTMKSLLDRAGVADNSNTPTDGNEFTIRWTNFKKLRKDWCDTNSRWKPITKCKNDGYMFEASSSDGGRTHGFFDIKSGLHQTTYERYRKDP